MGRQIKRSDDGRGMGDGTVSFAARDRTLGRSAEMGVSSTSPE
jgi:hypothetical protein